MEFQEELERIISKAYKEIINESELLPTPYKILTHIKYNNYDLVFGEEVIDSLDVDKIIFILKESKHAFRNGGIVECNSQYIFNFFRV